MFSFESPHQGDSNQNTKYTIFNMKKENHTKLSQICSYRIFSKGLKNEFETAVVNESSVFEPLKFYCIRLLLVSCPGVNEITPELFFGGISKFCF